jgi:DNA-binding LacI/PurR family transcriptional regulator
MFDVAKLAGVSHQTVSRVLHGHPNVRDATRARVRAAIDELGYRPNRAARALVTGHDQVLGVIAPRSTLFGPVSLLAALEEHAGLAGFGVGVRRVRELDEVSITEAVDRHLERRVSGIVVIAPVASASRALAALPHDLPVVTIDGDPARPGAMVTVDQEAGARLATRHLLDAGHETVWHVAGPEDWFDAAGRRTGWERELRASGIEAPPVLAANWSPAAGYRAGMLLARIPEATAVFAANDALALGVLRALSERRRRVPEDVAVVGFDDVPEAAYLIPPLTTVRQDFEQVGRVAVELLLEQLDGQPPQGIRTVPPELVVRDSSAGGTKRRP